MQLKRNSVMIKYDKRKLFQNINSSFIPYGEDIMKRTCLAQQKSKSSSLPCTFIIKVMYTERNTIQGYIQWIEKEKTVAFRSYMELLHLTQDALCKSQNSFVDFRYWDI